MSWTSGAMGAPTSEFPQVFRSSPSMRRGSVEATLRSCSEPTATAVIPFDEKGLR